MNFRSVSKLFGIALEFCSLVFASKLEILKNFYKFCL